uniref:AAA family ATPase n=1 Tax=candidate division WOR-3 bacterium TaxID=2052148 RepID=A0A7V4E278_UNCW3
MRRSNSVNIKGLKDLLIEIAKKVQEGKAFEIPALFIWGPPGVGKSTIIREVAKEYNLKVIDLRLAQIDPADLRGIPFPDKETKRLVWWIPEFFPKDGKGFLFLDELNLADLSIQATAYQLVLDRRVGNYKLPDGWYVLAAGNRKEDAVNVFEMPDPLVSRFIHIEVEPDLDIWIEWAVKKGISEEIIAYLKYRPENFINIKPNRVSIAYPCPRTWEFADIIWKLTKNVETVAWAVGGPVAADFVAFLEVYRELPDIEKALETGEIDFPSREKTSMWWAISTALGLRPKNQRHIDNVAKILLDIRKNFVEYGSYILNLILRDGERGLMLRKSKFYNELREAYFDSLL